MRRFLLCAVAALALTGCMNRGKSWYQDADAVAGAQSAGYSDVTVWRPDFTCQVPPTLTSPIVPIASNSGSTYGQDGHFLTATSPAGQHVRLMICEGAHLPTRIQEIGASGTDFEPTPAKRIGWPVSR